MIKLNKNRCILFVFILSCVCCQTYTEKTYWPNNKLKSKIVRDKKSHLYAGRYAEYYNNGQIQEERFYKNDLLTKELTEWHENGQIKLHDKIYTTTLDTLTDSVAGNLRQTYIYVMDYDQITYYTNGQVEKKGRYIQSKKSGLWLFYDSTGKETKRALYENDSIISF